MMEFFKSIHRWFTEKDYRKDINYRRWGVRTSNIKGSHCGCCGKWVEGDPGSPDCPPDLRWTLCPKCAGPVVEDNSDESIFARFKKILRR